MLKKNLNKNLSFVILVVYISNIFLFGIGGHSYAIDSGDISVTESVYDGSECSLEGAPQMESELVSDSVYEKEQEILLVDEPETVSELEVVEAVYDIDALDAEVYLMEKSETMTEENLMQIIWPELELDEIQLDTRSSKLELHTEILQEYGKDITYYGYVWSYDYEDPTIEKNQGSVQIGTGEVSSFDYFIDYEGPVFVRAYVVYDGVYVGYSNQRQYDGAITESLEKSTYSTLSTRSILTSGFAPRSLMALPESSPGSTFFKDSGDDLDKLRVAVLLNAGYLKVNLDVNKIPSDSAYLVLRGKFGGLAHLNLNGNFLGWVGTDLNNNYYGFKLPKDFIRDGNNKIEMYVYGLAWAKIDSAAIIIDGGEKVDGGIADISLEDWDINYDSSNECYYTDIYANTSTQNINTGKSLRMVNSIGLFGSNHFSSTEYSSLDDTSDTYKYRITLPDKVKYNLSGNWRLYSMLLDGKRPIAIDSKGFYYRDSKGLRSFGMKFNQDSYEYRNDRVNIHAVVDDFFKKPFGYIVLPDGSRVYDYEADYEVFDNGEYVFKVVEPDGTETEFIHEVSNIDRNAPSIELIGGSIVTIMEGEPYLDMGVTLKDDLSGFASYEPTIEYNGFNCMGAEPGRYTITYSISDSAGNPASVSRDILVKHKPLEVVTGDSTKNCIEVSINARINYLGEDLILEKGLVWGVVANPTMDKSDGIYSLSTGLDKKDIFATAIPMSSLLEGAIYNYRGYVKNSKGEVVYGANKTFEASDKFYGEFGWTSTQHSVARGNTVSLAIERVGGADSEVDVYYRTLNGSAVSGTQFTENQNHVHFAKGDSSSKTVNISTYNYETWEKTNREFYVEIYQLDGKGNIGEKSLAIIRFNDDIDSIAGIGNNSWTKIYSRGETIYSSDGKRCFPSSSGISIDEYNYWKENADQFLGRVYGDLYTWSGAIGFGLEKNTGSYGASENWPDVSYKYYESSDSKVWVNSDGNDIRNAMQLRLIAVIADTDNLGGGKAGLEEMEIQINANDSTAPFLESLKTVAGNYSAGDAIYISTKFNEIVNLVDSTSVKLNIRLFNSDNTEFVQKADYVSGKNTDTLVFKFNVPEGKFNSRLEFASAKFDHPAYVVDLVGHTFGGSSDSVISPYVKIASVGHEVNLAPNGDSNESATHSTDVTVSCDKGDGVEIVSAEYLWASDKSTKVKGFKRFNSGDSLSIDGATGNYYLHVRTRDNYGNESYFVSNAFALNNLESKFSLIPSSTVWTKEDIVISLDGLPVGANLVKKQYKKGFYNLDTFDQETGDFVEPIDMEEGNSFSVKKNGVYSVYLETALGKKYINSISVMNIDKIPPLVEILQNGTGGEEVYLGSTEVKVSDEGDSLLKSIQYQWTQDSSTPGTGWIDFNPEERLEIDLPGTWYLHFRVSDNAGNITVLCSKAFIVDTDAPELTVSGINPCVWTLTPVLVSVEANKTNLSHVMMPDSTSVDAVEGMVSTTYEADKNGFYNFIAVDESGNTTEDSINITKVDTDAPKVIVVKSEDGWTKNDVSLTIAADDDTSAIFDENGDFLKYEGVGGISIKAPGSDCFEPYNLPLDYLVCENGIYKVEVKDRLGNLAVRNIDISNIDKTPPFVEASNTDYGAKKEPISIELFYRDKEMGLVKSKEYKITGDANLPVTYEQYEGRGLNLVDPGTYYIHYRAKDGVENSITGYFGPYTIDPLVPSITIESSDAEIYEKSHSTRILVDFNGMDQGDIFYQWTKTLEIPTENWSETVLNNALLEKNGETGDCYLHLKVTAGGKPYYASRLFKFDNNPPSIELRGESPAIIPYGGRYLEQGVSYADDIDFWPEYIAPDSGAIDTKVLGRYTLEYKVVDGAGNASSVYRDVVVVDEIPPEMDEIRLEVREDEVLRFNKEQFKASYSDDLTEMSKIQILALPKNGELRLENEIILSNQIIEVDDIDKMDLFATEDWNGTISIPLVVYDLYGNKSDASSIEILVKPVNDPPVAFDDRLSTYEDEAISLDVRSNDMDIEDKYLELAVSNITQGAHGAVVKNSDGTLRYTPNRNFNGEDCFEYTIRDKDGAEGTAKVEVTIAAVNDRPSDPKNLVTDTLSPYKYNQEILLSWDDASDVDGDKVFYEVDYFDGATWKNITKNTDEISVNFRIPDLDIKALKFRVRSMDSYGTFSGYLESGGFEVDSTLPHVDLSLNERSWGSSLIRIDFNSNDDGGSGVEEVLYCVSNLLDEDSWSAWSTLKAADFVEFSDDGVYRIKTVAIDRAGNMSEEVIGGVYRIDKQIPEAFLTRENLISDESISILGMTQDSTEKSNLVSGDIVYDFAIDGVYTGTYRASESYFFKELLPNTEYSFKMKAKDKAGNVIETPVIKKYTRAKNVSGINLNRTTKSSISLETIPGSPGRIVPEHEVWLTEVGKDEIVAATGYSRELSRSFEGLSENTEYDVWSREKNEQGLVNAGGKIAVCMTNKVPVVEIDKSESNIYKKTGENIELSGKILNGEVETVEVYATISGVTKSVSFTTEENETEWKLCWNVDEDNLAEENYKGTKVRVKDSNGDVNQVEYLGDMVVDKTLPEEVEILVNEEWSPKDSEKVEIKNKGDLGSGVEKIIFELSGAQSTEGYLDYKGPVLITKEGVTTIRAKAVDKSGNIGIEATKKVKIDCTNPSVDVIEVTGTKFTNGKTKETVGWTNEDYFVKLEYIDSNGIDRIYYEVTRDEESLEIFDDFVLVDMSETEKVMDIDKIIPVTIDGENYIHYKIVDIAGNEVLGYFGPYKLDKSEANEFNVKIENVGERKIEISGITEDCTEKGEVVSGDIVYGYAIDGAYLESYDASGRYIFEDLRPGKEYSFNMRAKDAAGNIIETDEIKQFTHSESSYIEEITVDADINNEAVLDIVEEITWENNFSGDLRIELDAEKIIENIEKSLQTGRNLLSLQMEADSNLSIEGLSGYDVKQMEEKAVDIRVGNEKAIYILPAEEINIDYISHKLGEDVNLRDISVKIEISGLDETEKKKIRNVAKEKKCKLIGSPVEFSVNCYLGDKKAAVDKFDEYVEREIAIPGYENADKVTTAVVFDADGNFRHVPTKLAFIDGKDYVQINSLTNSKYLIIYNEKEFDDVEAHWAEAEINEMASRLIIKGMTEDEFAPERKITRAEFAAITLRALGIKESNYDSSFGDITPSDWYHDAIVTAHEFGLIGGYPDNTVKPNHTITREEAIAMVMRAAKIADLDTSMSEEEAEAILEGYVDYSEASNWSKGVVAFSIKEKIFVENGKHLNLGEEISRAETAVIILRMLRAADLV